MCHIHQAHYLQPMIIATKRDTITKMAQCKKNCYLPATIANTKSMQYEKLILYSNMHITYNLLLQHIEQ